MIRMQTPIPLGPYARAPLTTLPMPAGETATNDSLPNWLVYSPLVVFWILLGIRHRDFAVATLANPRIPMGGLCNESKSQILGQAGPDAARHIAPWRVFPAGPDADAVAYDAMRQAGLSWPVVLKPDIGCKGAGVRLIRTPAALRDTLAAYAPGTYVMVQRFIPHEAEAGIFYSRLPTEETGRILSMTFKSTPKVVGDGVSTLRALVLAHPHAGRAPDLYLPRLGPKLDDIPPKGATVSLVFTGNHSKGAQFRDATHLVTAALTRKIDTILRAFPDFHHGRIDLKFSSLGELQNGHGFEIIEVNGIGSEPIHMWSSDKTWLDLYKIQFQHYGRAFRIGAALRTKYGHRSKGAFNMLWQWRRQVALIATYPSSE